MTPIARALIVALIGAAPPAPTDAQVNSPVLIDGAFSATAGATITASLGAAAARAEGAVVPNALFDERGTMRRAANIAFRAGKLAAFDLPQEHLLLVVDHEVFGHGARLRERFEGPIRYTFDAPWPYGRNRAATTYALNRPPTWHEQLAIATAGMEATFLTGDVIARDALAQDRLQWRDAVRYLLFDLDATRYMWQTNGGAARGHDVAGFLLVYNSAAASIGAHPLTAAMLRRRTLATLVDPTLTYAAFAAVRYMWNGATAVSVPALSIAQIRYLPRLRYQLVPYGTEWSVITDVGGRVPATHVQLRFGRTLDRPTRGVRVAGGWWAWSGWTFHTSFDVWQQPDLAPRSMAVASPMRVGFAGRSAVSRVMFGRRDLAALVDVGVKTAGFVAGEPLGRGVVIRAGLAVRLADH